VRDRERKRDRIEREREREHSKKGSKRAGDDQTHSARARTLMKKILNLS
jgi:hypothetical protein